MDVIIEKSEVDGKASPPPSKSYTHRVFIAASLSRKCEIDNYLISEDTLATLRSCSKIGADFVRRDGLTIRGVDEIVAEGYFNMANSGTTLRLFTGLLSLSKSGRFAVLDGDGSLRKRPNHQLVEALKKLGAEVRGDVEFRPPFWVKGVIKGGRVVIEKVISSQFISSLLISLPLATGNSEVAIRRMKSGPYVDITLHVLDESGIKIEREGTKYYVEGEQSYRLRKFSIPSDFSSASYLIAAGLLSGKVVVENMFDSEQGDKRIVEICRKMGGRVKWSKDRGTIVAEKSELEGVSVDASQIPDLVPTIAVLGAVAGGKTEIHNAEHLRYKEIDRIEGIYRNLTSLGVEVKKKRDGIVVYGGKYNFRGTVNSFGDHRMALAFSLLGLLGEVRVKNAEVVSVSYPSFFETLKKLGAKVFISRE
jgi:3-phosphoshikimate 1-carboxyvinyltransferase